jgi:hypothetical protein
MRFSTHWMISNLAVCDAVAAMVLLELESADGVVVVLDDCALSVGVSELLKA